MCKNYLCKLQFDTKKPKFERNPIKLNITKHYVVNFLQYPFSSGVSEDPKTLSS